MKQILLAALPLLLLTGSTAMGSTVQTNIAYSFGGSGVIFHEGEEIWLNANGTVEQGYAGVIQVSVDGGPTIHAFCVDLFTPIGLSTYNTVLSVPVGNQTRASWLLGNVEPGITTPTDWAALQFAIWDIIHDGGDGFSSGMVQQVAGSTNAAVLGQAEAYVAMSLGMSSTSFAILNNTTISGGVPQQNLIAAMAAPDGGEVPEPGTYFAGLVAVGLAALKSRKTAQKA